jgi:Zn-finger nucleic acid-binding protein
MKCPVCPATDLVMTVREGIELDYCPKCRGVWLDRGELDQIIRRSAQASQAEAQAEIEAYRRDEHERERPAHRHDDDYRYGDPRDRRAHPRRKKSFLGDLFDLD